VIITKDNISARLDANVNYKIMDPIITTYTINDIDFAIE